VTGAKIITDSVLVGLRMTLRRDKIITDSVLAGLRMTLQRDKIITDSVLVGLRMTLRRDKIITDSVLAGLRMTLQRDKIITDSVLVGLRMTLQRDSHITLRNLLLKLWHAPERRLVHSHTYFAGAGGSKGGGTLEMILCRLSFIGLPIKDSFLYCSGTSMRALRANCASIWV